MADKKTVKFSSGAILGIAGVVALVAVIFFAMGFGKKEEKAETIATSTSSSSKDKVSIFDLLSGGKIVQCEGAEDVLLQDEDGDGHISLIRRPCRSGYITLPLDWSGFELVGDPDEELVLWDIQGRAIRIPRGASPPFRNPGRTFQYAGPAGTLHLYRKGSSNLTSMEKSFAGIKTVEGSVVQSTPEYNLLVLKAGPEEMKFQTSRNTPVNVGNKTFYLGRQGLLSLRERIILEPGDSLKVKYQEATMNVVGIDLQNLPRDEAPPTKEAHREIAQISKESKSGLEIPLIAEDKSVVRGVYEKSESATLISVKKGEISETTGQVIRVRTIQGTETFSVFPHTQVLRNGESCYVESLRPGDVIDIELTPGTQNVERIVSGLEARKDHGSESAPKGDPFTNEYWGRLVNKGS